MGRRHVGRLFFQHVGAALGVVKNEVRVNMDDMLPTRHTVRGRTT